MKLDKAAIARVLCGTATQRDLQDLGRENVYAIKSDASAVHHYYHAKAAAPGVNVEARTARYELSNDLQDRSGDVVSISGIDLKNWQANPVWSYNHDWKGGDSLPIGRPQKAVKKTLDDRRALMVDVLFHGAEKNPKADLVWRLVKDGDMPASSIGARPLDGGVVRPKNETERKAMGLGPYGVYLAKIEMLEGSSVFIPDNPGALAKKLDDLAERGEFSWAVIGELAETLKQAKGRAFVAQNGSNMEVIDELEPESNKSKAAPEETSKAAPLDMNALRMVIREEVSAGLEAARVKAAGTSAPAEPTRQDSPARFYASLLEAQKKSDSGSSNGSGG